MLINELSEESFDPLAYKDEYRERLMKFIESKGKGHKPRLSAAKGKRASSTSLDSVLKRSLAALKKGKKAA